MIDLDVETVIENSGGFNGRHTVVILSIFLTGIQIGLMTFTSVFIFDVPDHRCFIPDVDKAGYNITKGILQQYIPFVDEKLSQCCRYSNITTTTMNSSNNILSTETMGNMESCQDDWIFYNEGRTTGTMQFNLVCENAWQRTLLTFGFAIGALLFGVTAGAIVDRYGRKKPSIVYGVLMSLVLVAYSYAPNFPFCVVCFTLLGGFNSVGYFTAFVYAQEMVKTSQRAAMGCIIYMFESASCMLLPLIAYLCSDWRWIVRIIGLYGIVYIPCIWTLVESPRWLVSRGRTEEAIHILKSILKKDKSIDKIWRRPLPLLSVAENQNPIKGTARKVDEIEFSMLFKNSVLLKRCIIISWLICVTLGSFYAFGYNTSNLGGNIYLNCFISAASEFPGWIFSPYFLQRFGRRATMSGAYALSCFCSILCPLFGNYHEVSIGFAMLGKMFMSSTLAMVYLYPSEIFPTPLRSVALGFCSTLSRIGSVFAPFLAFAGETRKWVPFYVLSFIALAASVVTLLLPETKGTPLPETVSDAMELEKFRLKFPCAKRNQRKDENRNYTKNKGDSLMESSLNL